MEVEEQIGTFNGVDGNKEYKQLCLDLDNCNRKLDLVELIGMEDRAQRKAVVERIEGCVLILKAKADSHGKSSLS